MVITSSHCNDQSTGVFVCREGRAACVARCAQVGRNLTLEDLTGGTGGFLCPTGVAGGFQCPAICSGSGGGGRGTL